MGDAFGAAVGAGISLAGGHDAVLAGVGAGHVLDSKHAGVVRHRDIHQLLHGGRVGVDQVVGEQDCEGLVAHGRSRRQHCMA
ncbi:hypothetical protein D3C72_1875950 [compost metagenome]